MLLFVLASMAFVFLSVSVLSLLVGAAQAGPPRRPHAHTARPHAFDFVHRMLPWLVFDRPDFAWTTLRGARGPVLAHALWELVGDRQHPSDRLPSDGLAVDPCTLPSGREVVVIVPPRATSAFEADFVALVQDGGRLRYFVLERMASGSHFLAEWTSPRSRDHGPTVEGQDESAFLRAIDAALARRAA